MKTLNDLIAAPEVAVEFDAHLATDLEIPVLSGLQAQGDLLIIPASLVGGAVRLGQAPAWVSVPAGGVELLRGAAGGNAHTLVADPGVCLWTTDVRDDERLALGVIQADAPVYLLHREHGGTGLAPGRYVVRRQREQAEEQRLVAD